MKHTRALIVLALALLAGLVSVSLAARWLSGHKSSGSQIAVAAREIDLGTALDASAITTLAWPSGTPPEGSFGDPAALQGRVLRTALARGEPILASKLAPVGARGGLSAAIGEGRRAITVRVNEVIGVAGFALPGNLVDVMVHTTVDDARRGGSGTPLSKIVLEGILVLAVAQEASRDEMRPKVVNAVTLEVTPEQAELLDVARSVGNLSLVLRNPADRREAGTAGMGKADLLRTASAATPTPPPAAPRPAVRPRAATASVPAAPATATPAAPTAAAVTSPPTAAPESGARIEVIRGVSRSTVEL
ncbi:MAG: Flp pilus assembly protein CpaB [Pseudomonadota bacterium]|jgi:pilus assembly protein CpaB